MTEFQAELKEKLGKGGSQVQRRKMKIRQDMDHDYRDYYREPRGRGEFLTRGAALASGTVMEGYPNVHHNANVYSVGQRANPLMPPPGAGPEVVHDHLEREPRRFGRGGSSGMTAKESRRNPTILRKSEYPSQ